MLQTRTIFSIMQRGTSAACTEQSPTNICYKWFCLFAFKSRMPFPTGMVYQLIWSPCSSAGGSGLSHLRLNLDKHKHAICCLYDNLFRWTSLRAVTQWRKSFYLDFGLQTTFPSVETLCNVLSEFETKNLRLKS